MANTLLANFNFDFTFIHKSFIFLYYIVARMCGDYI
jgi:hypothetical protein